MRKNKKGRIKKEKLKKLIVKMRDDGDMSYKEIGDELGMSKQLVFYHYKTADKVIHTNGLDKKI